MLSMRHLAVLALTAALCAPAQADGSPQYSITSMRAEAFRTLPIGSKDTARTGVIGAVAPANDSFLVLNFVVSGDPEDSEKALQTVPLSSVALHADGLRIHPIGRLGSVTEEFSFFPVAFTDTPMYAFHYQSSKGYYSFRIVFDDPDLGDGPWEFEFGGLRVPVEAPAVVNDSPPRPAELVEVEILNITRHRMYNFGAGPRSLNRVTYVNPGGVFIKVHVRLTQRSGHPPKDPDAPTCCATGVTIPLNTLLLRDTDTGASYPIFITDTTTSMRQSFGSSIPVPSSAHIHDNRPQEFIIHYATPASIGDVELVLLGDRVAVGAVR